MDKTIFKIIKYLFLLLFFIAICWYGFVFFVHYYLVAGYYKSDDLEWIENKLELSDITIFFQEAWYKINFISGNHRIEFEISIKNETNSPLCFYPQRIKILKLDKNYLLISKNLIYQDKFFIYPSKEHIWSNSRPARSGKALVKANNSRQLYLFIDAHEDDYKKVSYLDTEAFQEPLFLRIKNMEDCELN